MQKTPDPYEPTLAGGREGADRPTHIRRGLRAEKCQEGAWIAREAFMVHRWKLASVQLI